MDKLRLLREERGFSQEKLAELCGMSRVAISNIETGKTTEIKLSTLRTFSKVFNVPVEFFLT